MIILKKSVLVLFVIIWGSVCVAGKGSIKRGPDLTKDEFQEVLEKCENSLPKVWAAMNAIKDQGVHIKLSGEKMRSPGKAGGTDRMMISSFHLTNELPNYPEDRLVIVLYHEFGHNLYNRNSSQEERNPTKHEFEAFSHSLVVAKEMAQNGDSGPLSQVLHFLKLRVERGKPNDPHTKALKLLVVNALWKECEAVLEEIVGEPASG